jgi:hypothetical protein
LFCILKREPGMIIQCSMDQAKRFVVIKGPHSGPCSYIFTSHGVYANCRQESSLEYKIFRNMCVSQTYLVSLFGNKLTPPHTHITFDHWGAKSLDMFNSRFEIAQVWVGRIYLIGQEVQGSGVRWAYPTKVRHVCVVGYVRSGHVSSL